MVRKNIIDKKHVLLVDDNPDFCTMTASLLQYHNYKVDFVHTGKQVMDKVKHHPDIILLDRNLPDIDGLDVCRYLREDKRWRGIPIIILSGRNKSEEKIEGLYVGADDYVTKPFHNEELLARIAAVLRRSQFSDQIQSEKVALMADLKEILQKELITPFFQPIYHVKPTKLLGFEMLSRPPEGRLLSNPEFLFKAALTLGRYFDLEMICWRKAVSQWINYSHMGKLFLNCSPYLVESTNFDTSSIEKQGVKLANVVFEITERVGIQDYAVFIDKLKYFKKAGVNTAVDDVGCGFASLDTVAEIGPEFVKIDISLVREIHENGLKQNIVEAIVSFCKKSRILTIAEGIEKKEELKKVMELGVDAVQGYLLGRPAMDIAFKIPDCLQV